MMMPLAGISEEQREHFQRMQEVYRHLNRLLPYANFILLSDQQQEDAITKAESFIRVASVGVEEKFQVYTYLVLLKVKGKVIKYQERINAILDYWEEAQRGAN